MSRIHGLFLSVLALSALTAVCSPAKAQLTFTYQNFDVPGADPAGSVAGGISASGDIAGTYLATDGSLRGYIRHNDTFTDVIYPGSNDTEFWAGGINSAGYATGHSYDDQGNQTNFIYHNGAFTAPTISGATSMFYGNVTESGIVAIQYGDTNGALHNASYNIANDSFNFYPDIAGYDNDLQAIAANGDLLINLGSGSNLQGALVHNGVPTFLNFPGADRTAANAITTTGLITGNYLDAVGRHGFVYDSNQSNWYSIDAPDATYTALYYGNNDTQFVGVDIDRNGIYHSLIVTVATPEPGSIALFCAGGMTGVAFLRRRKSRNVRGAKASK